MVALSRNVHKKCNGDAPNWRYDWFGKSKEIGLINDFESEKLTKTVMALADKIACKPASTVATGRRLL